MPFIGKDWRSPGNKWIRVSHTSGWELSKLRPIQLNTVAGIVSTAPANGHAVNAPIDIPPRLRDSSIASTYSTDELPACELNCSFDCSPDYLGSSVESYSSIISQDNIAHSDADDSAVDMDDDEVIAMPHCKVKTGRSKEFIGCTSISETLHRLDFARAVSDVRRFNYICKVVQILVNDKLQNLSATARKHLFAIVQAIVLHSIKNDIHLTLARDLLGRFSAGLKTGHVCGSPVLANLQQDVVASLLEISRNSLALPDSSEDSTTFLDLPREVLSQILRCLPDHLSLLEAAKAHETLNELIEQEKQQWRTLTQFHFTQIQIDKHQTSETTWRHLFFELKKYYGLREIYADLIHICCHCKSLFWKDHGHPCVGSDAPSVRVTPQQFVDMLTWL